jgi:potassium-transporting ATPase KdpC subunit
MSLLRPAFVIFAVLATCTGLAYPLLITGVARLVFPSKSGGSLLTQGDRVRGSALLGQHTEDPRYFWGRLSATPGHPTNGGASGGSNRSASNPDLRAAAEGRIRALRALDPGNLTPVPVDLVTASGSGLDPHISPAAAEYQVARVARLRGLGESRVRDLVARFREPRQLGFLGEPRVNVLRLNLALDELGQGQ